MINGAIVRKTARKNRAFIKRMIIGSFS